MVNKRKHISLKTKLASALLALGDVPYDHAKLISEDEIISLYNFDHGILHAVEIQDSYWNLTPRLIAPHRQKSRRDTSIVAHVKRLSKKQEDFRRCLLAKGDGEDRIESERPKRKISQSKTPWPNRKMSWRKKT